MSRLVSDKTEETPKKTRLNKRQKRQQVAAAVVAIILVGAMVFTLVPSFFQ